MGKRRPARRGTGQRSAADQQHASAQPSAAAQAPAQPTAVSAQGIRPKRAGFFHGAGVWVAGIVSGILIAAGATWFLAFGRSVADNSGPPFAAIVDVAPLSARCSALTAPITSAADRVTFLSGTASVAQVMALIARHGGVNVGRMDVTLILEGRRSSLRIVDIQPQVLPPKSPPTAALLQYESAGSVPVIPVTANLNQPFPVLETKSGPYFNTEEVDLVHGERETFRISFRATTGYYEFNLLVTYVTGGKQYQQTIPGPTDGVFRLAGAAADSHDYGTVYAGVNGNQFEVASRSQSQAIFSKSSGCI
jgi:hypothetical protein